MSKISEKEIKLIRKSAAEFAKKALIPDRSEHDQYPFAEGIHDLLQQAYNLDFFHTILPEEFDGIAQGMKAFCVLLEEICTEDASLGVAILTNAVAQEIILMAGANDLLKTITSDTPKMADFIIAFPIMNNPSEITHVARAIFSGSEYLLSGKLEYLVLGNLATHAVIPAVINDDKSFSWFLIDLTNNQSIKSDPILSLGVKACPAVDLTLYLTPGQLIGEPEKGALYFDKMSSKMAVASAAMSLGLMRGSYASALEYCKQREQGGKKIIQWSEMKMILAEMGIQIQVGDMCVTSAAHAIEEQLPNWNQKSLAAAIHVQSQACQVTSSGIQVLGGVGYMQDFPQEKRFRDAQHIQSLFGLAPLKKIRFINDSAKI